MFNSSLYPYASIGTKTGLFAALKNIKWGTLLSNTQKTLGVINQAIPIVYQIKPIWNNAKTVFRIVGAIKDDDSSKQSKTTNSSIIKNNNYNNYSNTVNNSNSYIEGTSTTTYSNNNQPNFFL